MGAAVPVVGRRWHSSSRCGGSRNSTNGASALRLSRTNAVEQRNQLVVAAGDSEVARRVPVLVSASREAPVAAGAEAGRRAAFRATRASNVTGAARAPPRGSCQDRSHRRVAAHVGRNMQHAAHARQGCTGVRSDSLHQRRRALTCRESERGGGGAGAPAGARRSPPGPWRQQAAVASARRGRWRPPTRRAQGARRAAAEPRARTAEHTGAASGGDIWGWPTRRCCGAFADCPVDGRPRRDDAVKISTCVRAGRARESAFARPGCQAAVRAPLPAAASAAMSSGAFAAAAWCTHCALATRADGRQPRARAAHRGRTPCRARRVVAHHTGAGSQQRARRPCAAVPRGDAQRRCAGGLLRLEQRRAQACHLRA